MSLLSRAQYQLNVAVGEALLRFERIRSERTIRRPDFWKKPHLAPPLPTSPWLKELISRHYLKGRYANLDRKVAWVTSGAPVEFLVALDYYVLYPENHAAVCGIRRVAEELAERAEAEGYSRDVCSYARTDFGSLLSGKTPVGKLPRPDLLLCCTNICQTVLYWYRVLADHFGVPLILVDTPFTYDDDPTDHAVAFVKQQLEAAVETAEQVAGRSLSHRRLQEVSRLSKEASYLWLQVVQHGRHRPAPLTAFDEFIHMAPIVEMRGEAFTVDYYRGLLADLDHRVARGIGAVTGERRRLLWDNLPIWHRMRWLSDFLAHRGVALVASTYTNAWAELCDLVDPARPIESAARVYIQPILNRSSGDKLRTIRQLASEYQADGVILHSDRSCKPYSIGQIDQRQQLAHSGIPALLLDADHTDPRAFSTEQVEGRLAAFLEVLGL